MIASCGLMVVTGLRLAPQATVTPWHAALIIIGTRCSPSRRSNPFGSSPSAAVLRFGASVARDLLTALHLDEGLMLPSMPEKDRLVE